VLLRRGIWIVEQVALRYLWIGGQRTRADMPAKRRSPGADGLLLGAIAGGAEIGSTL